MSTRPALLLLASLLAAPCALAADHGDNTGFERQVQNFDSIDCGEFMTDKPTGFMFIAT